MGITSTLILAGALPGSRDRRSSDDWLRRDLDDQWRQRFEPSHLGSVAGHCDPHWSVMPPGFAAVASRPGECQPRLPQLHNPSPFKPVVVASELSWPLSGCRFSWSLSSLVVWGILNSSLPAIAVIVGLHFIPLAMLFDFPLYYCTGGTFVFVAIAPFAIGNLAPRQAITCLGCGLALWLTSAVLLLPGSRGHPTRPDYPR